MAGNDKNKTFNSPFLEKFSKKGYEVLYLTEPVDEVTLSNLGKY